MYNELTGGLSYYDFITDLTENFESKNQEIIEKLQQTEKLLYNKNNLIANITCSKKKLYHLQKKARRIRFRNDGRKGATKRLGI